MELWNAARLPEAWTHVFPKAVVTRCLGGAAGTKGFYVNIDTLPPGTYSAKYHAHTVQEEFFLILQGWGTLRTAQGEQPVGPGDFFAKPCGDAHTFYNSGTEPLVILDVGVNAPGDTAVYPDEDVYYLRAQGLALRGGQALPDWSPEPNTSDP